MKFYICKHCGNLVTHFRSSGVPIVCCGEPMAELIPGTTDAATEKHIPVVTTEGSVVTVKVSSVAHPMLEAHFIQWIVLETDKGFMTRYLHPGEEAIASFVLADGEQAVAAYEFCNLHGLWKTEL